MIRTKDNKNAIAISRNKDGQVYLALARRGEQSKLLAIPITDTEARQVISELTGTFELKPERKPSFWEKLFGTVSL